MAKSLKSDEQAECNLFATQQILTDQELIDLHDEEMSKGRQPVLLDIKDGDNALESGYVDECILGRSLFDAIENNIKLNMGITSKGFPKDNARFQAEYDKLLVYAANIKHKSDILDMLAEGEVQFLGFNNDSPVFVRDFKKS